MNLLSPYPLENSTLDDAGQLVNEHQTINGHSQESVMANEPVMENVADETLTAILQEEVGVLAAEKDTFQITLWQRDLALSDASARIAQLTETISLLTRYSSELAASLEERNQEYAIAIQRLSEALTRQPDGRVRVEVLSSNSDGLRFVHNGDQPSVLVGAGFSALEEQVELLKSDLRASQQAKRELEQRIGVRDRSLSELTGAVDALRMRMNELAQDNEDLAARVVQRDKVIADLKETLAAHQVEVDLLTAESAELHEMRAEIAAVKDERDSAAAAAAELEALLMMRLVALNESDAQVAALKDENESLSQRNAELEMQAPAYTSDMAELRNQLSALETAKADVDLAIAEKEAALASLTLAAESDAQAIQEKDEALAQLSLENSALKEQYAASQSDLESQLQYQNGALDSLMLQLATIRTEQNAVLTAKSALEQQLSDRAAELAGVRQELDANVALQSQLSSSLESTIAENATESEKWRAQMQVYEQEAAELRDRLAEWQTSMETLMAEKDKFASQVVASEAEITDLRSQVGSLQGLLEQANQDKGVLEAQVVDRQTQFEALQETLAQSKAESDQTIGEQVAQIAALSLAAGVASDTIREKSIALEQTNVQIASLQEQLKALSSAASIAASTIQEKSDALDRANEQIGLLQSEVYALNASKTEVEGNLIEAESNLIEKEKELFAQRDHFAHLLNTLDEFMEREIQQRAELETLKSAKAQIDALLDQREAEMTEQKALLDQQSEDLKLAAVAAAEMKKLFNLPTHLRTESALTDGVASKREPVVAAIIAGIQPVLTSQPQNLSQIDGIDNIFEKRLFAAGVGSYWEVANLHNTVFEQILKLDELQHSDFPFDEVRANAFSMAQQTETIGLIWEGQQVDDFDAVAGMGDSFEQQHA